MPVIASIETDFSTTQGSGGWYYGYYESSVSTTFTMSGILNGMGSTWWYGPYNFNTPLIGYAESPTFTHPAVSESLHPAVRRWVSTHSGLVTVRSSVRMDSSGGNGVIGRIRHNTVSVASVAIANGDTVGSEILANITVAEGDFVDFVLESNGDSGNDSSFMTAVVETADAPTNGRILARRHAARRAMLCA